MISFFTFQDAIDHGLDYLGGNPNDQATRDCVRAVLSAYRDMANAFNWSYLYTQGRIMTTAVYDSTVAGATCAFLESSGSYPRQCTITGDVWPTWAADGVIRIGASGEGTGSYSNVDPGPDTAFTVGYKVDQRISATIITLDEVIQPYEDIPAGTTFTLYQDTYVLPDDFMAQDQALYELNFGGMNYTHPREWLFENRYVFASGVPQFFTITGERKYPGRLVTRMFPWPYQSKTCDYIYKRRPRQLLIQGYNVGTVAATSGTNTIIGSGTTFTPAMVGSTIRLSANASPPSSLVMQSNIAAFESIVTSYISATQVGIYDYSANSFSGVGYTISDTVDIEPGAMLTAYLRCIEKHIGMSRTLKDKPSAAKQYDVALSEAKSADSRSFQGRSVGDFKRIRPRLRDMPLDLTQTY